MKNTNRLIFALLAAAALVFAAGCSDSDDSGSGSTYNGDSDYYGTYSSSSLLSASGSISFILTSTSWSYVASGIGVSGSTWEYSDGYIYCYIDGSTDFYVLTVSSTNRLSFQSTILTKSSS